LSQSNGGNGAGSHDPYDALEFPCRFEIKVMGKPTNRFNALVGRIFTKHLEHREDLLQVLEKYSRGGRYVSVTYIIRARYKEQLRAIYRDLSQCEGVLMTL
jgi:putative lipoic acid-binding regulatory protein